MSAMTTFEARPMNRFSVEATETLERREEKRYDFDDEQILVERWGMGRPLGRLMDLSVSGMRVRTSSPAVRVDQQIRINLRLPNCAGISPFVDTADQEVSGKQFWVGWLTVTRIDETPTGEYDISGRMMGMDDLDRGMLSLYLSVHSLPKE